MGCHVTMGIPIPNGAPWILHHRAVACLAVSFPISHGVVVLLRVVVLVLAERG